MTGTRPPRREGLAATLLALLALSAVVAGATGVGLADDADHVTRNGDTLTIRLTDEHFDGEAEQITIAVEGEDRTTESSYDGNATDTFEVPVENVSTPGTDLSAANVTVKTDDGSVTEEGVDLRLLRFDAENAAFSGGTFEIPLAAAFGYADGADAAVTLDGDAEPVDGQIRYGDDGAVLAVSFEADRLSLPLPEAATIRASDRFQTQVNLRERARDAVDVSKLGDETLVVTHPFVVADGEYDLVVETTNPNATFAGAVRADGNGSMAVTDGALANADGWTVSAYRDGEVLFEDHEFRPASDERVIATVESNGAAVNLTGKSFDDAGATVWLRNSSRLVQFSAPVDNGTVNLAATDYRLDETGHYRLLVAGEQHVSASVPGNESNDTLYGTSPNGGVANVEDESEQSLPGMIPGGWFGMAGIASVLVLLLFGVVAVAGSKLTGGRSPPRSTAGGTAATHRETSTVTVVMKDAATGAPLDGTVTAVPKGGSAGSSRSDRRTEVTDGRSSLTLGRGRWELEGESNGVTATKTVRVRGNKEVPIELGPKAVGVTVTDEDGTSLSGLAVTCKPDEGERETRRTDDRGEVEIPVALAASEVELSADHEKYEDDATTVAFDDDATVRESLTLRRMTGDLEVTTSVDGTPVAGLPVEIRPREEAIRELGGGRTERPSGENAVARFEDLLVGRYEIRTTIPNGGDAFSVQSKRVRVRDGEQTNETLDATFEYGLDRSQRDRIESIRRDVDALDSATGRDVAIPRYYGSVLTDLIDAVERASNQGHRFATADADPDAVVDALLDAAENAVGLVDDAMTTKRNTDLFGACVDMPDERVEWQGSFDGDALFELLSEDRTTQRQTVLERFQRVDDRIDRERTDLAVVSPARELWDGVKEFVNSDRGDDPVRGAAVAFVAVGLLDAVDELFDHEKLRERLQRTVF